MRHRVFVRGGYRRNTISEAGGEATGPIFLDQNPTVNSQAATKQYVDSLAENIDAGSFVEGIIPVSRLPNFAGDLTKVAGSNSVSITPTGVAPGNYTRVTVNSKGQITAGTVLTEADLPDLDWEKFEAGAPTSLSGYGIQDGLNVNNPVMSGTLKVNGPFANSDDVVNKQYVDLTLVTRSRVGEIEYKMVESPPAGYLRANGGEVSKTLYPALYSVIGDKYGSYRTIGGGKPWEQTYETGATQSDPLTGFVSGSALPAALYAGKAIVTKDRVYLLCSATSSSTPISTFYTSKINADGTLGAWESAGDQGFSVYAGEVVVIKNKIYVIGGWNGTAAVAGIRTADIGLDGVIRNWRLHGSLPIAMYSSTAVVTKNRIYLLGGATAPSTGISNIYSATIDDDGIIGSWTLQGLTMPDQLYHGLAVIVKNNVYYLASVKTNLTHTTIYKATLNQDGTIGAFTVYGTYTGMRHSCAVFATSSRIFMLGGYINASTSVNTVSSAPIDTDGEIGTWVDGTPLPSNVSHGAFIATKNYLNLISGWNGSSVTSICYRVPFEGGLNDYSDYYDGSILNVSNSNMFRLPNIKNPYYGAYPYICYL